MRGRTGWWPISGLAGLFALVLLTSGFRTVPPADDPPTGIIVLAEDGTPCVAIDLDDGTTTCVVASNLAGLLHAGRVSISETVPIRFGYQP